LWVLAGPVAGSLCSLSIVVLLAFSQELLALASRSHTAGSGHVRLLQWPGGAPPEPEEPPLQRAWRELARSGVHHPLLHALTHGLHRAAPLAVRDGAVHFIKQLKQCVARRQAKGVHSRREADEECHDGYDAADGESRESLLREAAAGSQRLMHEVSIN
jgi:hypothetical protein